MNFNFSQVGISKYFYLMTTGQFREMSSSAARRAATQLDLAALPDLVAPQIVTRLLRYVLDAQNIFLVAGRTGSGKSTWLDAVARTDPRAYCIRADDFNRKLRPEMERLFPGENLVDVAMNREDEYLEAFKPKWLLLMARQLSQAPFGSNIYIEAAYGGDNKRLYENIGGDIIYVYCDNADTNRQRVVKRGTAHHQAFVEKIPDLAQSRQIAAEHRLNLREFNTDFPLEELDGRVKEFVDNLR
jgi:dephospho-CoA kinase